MGEAARRKMTVVIWMEGKEDVGKDGKIWDQEYSSRGKMLIKHHGTN